jgi:predicted NBD/HSP70 family sugar kinase
MILVFDIGATHTRLALSEDGQLSHVVHFDTVHSGPGLAHMLGAMHALAAGNSVKAVVGGMPGDLDEDGTLVAARNLRAWEGLPVGARIKSAFDCPVYIHNDVVMCGLGEARGGAGISEGVMVYYTVSTGVNAVRLVNGNLDRTIKRFEIGFELVGQEDGRVQSLEMLIGGGAMEKRLGRAPQEVHSEAVWRLAERNLAHGLYNTLLHWTPDVVVFGGSMMHDIRIDGVRRELAKWPQVLDRQPELKKAELGDLAGLHGAASWWHWHRSEHMPKQVG